MELDKFHPALLSLKELLPHAYISGGSFACHLPSPSSIAKDARRDEFNRIRQLAVSFCLNELLNQIPGQRGSKIHHGHGGEILWPSDYVGSLSHKGTVVLGAMIDQNSCPALGVDVERIGSENVAQINGVVAPEGLPPSIPISMGTLISFSAKEAVFKAQYPLTKARLEFEDVRLEWVQSDDPRSCISKGYCGALVFSIRVITTAKWLVSAATLLKS